VIEEVGHAQWVFVIPKMLRPYFLHHRELLGGLARAAWETVLELMRAAVDDETFRPGMVAVVQTSGDLGNWQPHLHALVARGGWTRDWEWVPVPYVDEHSAELLFRHKVMRLLQAEGLLSEERSELLLSWRHTGFSVHNRVRVEPEDQSAVEGGEPFRTDRDETCDGRALRRSWAQLIKRIYEVDPLVCPSCGGEMKVIAFIIEHEVVDRILRHLPRREEEGRERGPPGRSEFAAAW
jgi:hypothetical protein